MIEVKFSGDKLTARYRQRAQELGRAVLRAERANAEERKRAAITLSSGPYPTAYIRSLYKGNAGKGPYSTARPNPPAPPQIINKQSAGFGSISQMWQTRITNDSDGTRVTLFNTSPHAKYLLGTVRMIPRPILQAVENATRQSCFTRLAVLKSKALR